MADSTDKASSMEYAVFILRITFLIFRSSSDFTLVQFVLWEKK